MAGKKMKRRSTEAKGLAHPVFRPRVIKAKGSMEAGWDIDNWYFENDRMEFETPEILEDETTEP